ncbi:hypothetical protein ACPPVU_09380 [Mucilaginibacter sp. McL0603]|uniref:hypothetical protein n=1 Tax=Mucilaginibacter sp. McL0603 TaxID=3415670 RepID=UPI003CF156FC
MKNLIYSPFVLFIVLLAASCQKEPLVQQSKEIQPQDSLVAVSMINNSSTPYEVSFQGTTKSTVDIQANSRQVISVKAGAYNVEIYPAGASSYTSHTISWGGLAPINGPRANLNVLIPLASSQALLIY